MQHCYIMVINILISVGLGFLIGLEREKHKKAVGIRTTSLITLGSTMFSLISIHFTQADPTRVIAQIVTGIGFLSAGVIFKNTNQITGLTTAATIWCAAAVGILVGIGMFELAIESTLAILIINTIFTYFKNE